jgi:hypothetical protein
MTDPEPDVQSVKLPVWLHEADIAKANRHEKRQSEICGGRGIAFLILIFNLYDRVKKRWS